MEFIEDYKDKYQNVLDKMELETLYFGEQLPSAENNDALN